MLTATDHTPVAVSNFVSHNETAPSDAEIASRVLAIRSSWDVNERLARRRAAEQRFEKLLDALQAEVHAA